MAASSAASEFRNVVANTIPWIRGQVSYRIWIRRIHQIIFSCWIMKDRNSTWNLVYTESNYLKPRQWTCEYLVEDEGNEIYADSNYPSIQVGRGSFLPSQRSHMWTSCRKKRHTKCSKSFGLYDFEIVGHYHLRLRIEYVSHLAPQCNPSTDNNYFSVFSHSCWISRAC